MEFIHICKLPSWSELEVPTSTQSSCCECWISLSTCPAAWKQNQDSIETQKLGKAWWTILFSFQRCSKHFSNSATNPTSNQETTRFSMETMFPLSNRNKPGPLPSFHAKLHLWEQKGQTPTTTRVVHCTPDKCWCPNFLSLISLTSSTSINSARRLCRGRTFAWSIAKTKLSLSCAQQSQNVSHLMYTSLYMLWLTCKKVLTFPASTFLDLFSITGTARK